MSYHFGIRSRTNMIGLHPDIAFFAQKVMERTEQDFAICNRGGVRTDQEQIDMYAQGRTTEGNIVTWTLDSYHQYGLAVDLVAWVAGEYSWDRQYYAKIVKTGKEVIKKYDLPIEHGYDLWGRDLPHWQMTGYKPHYDIRKY